MHIYKSKGNLPTKVLLGVFTIFLQVLIVSAAKTVEITVDQIGNKALIKGSESGKDRVNLSFFNAIAGVEGFAERISDIEIFDKNGESLPVKKMMDGEFLTQNNFASWSYSVGLEPINGNSAAAHSSWLVKSSGVLMLADLLPLHMTRDQSIISLKLKLPPGFEIYSNSKQLGENVFEVSNLDNAIFYIGTDWNEVELPSTVPARLLFSGRWQVSFADSAAAVTEIYNEHKKLFGKDPNYKPVIAFMRFPAPEKPGDWQAETRGGNITIVSAEMHFPNQSRQRMHEQLRHEIFHLWLPNSVNLTGSYDWFYEGFALYNALKIGVKLGRISFNDFLNTIAQARRIEGVHKQTVSLTKASKLRWINKDSSIYARGMAIAFIIDIAIIEQARKNSVNDILREVYLKHSAGKDAVDGNKAILEIISSRKELKIIADNLIENIGEIDWERTLTVAGLKLNANSIVISDKLNGRQKAILNALRYNKQ